MGAERGNEMRIYMQKNDAAVTVHASYGGKDVIVGFEMYPLTTSLGSMTPNEARTLASMLVEQAATCELAIADDNRVRDAALELALAADEATPA